MNRRFARRWLALIPSALISLISTAAAGDDDMFVNQVGVLVEYFELDHSALPPLLREYQLAPDATNLLKTVQGMAEAGQARLVESSYLVARSGVHGKITSAREYLYPTEFDPPELPQTLRGPISGELDIITPTNPTAYDSVELGHALDFNPLTSVDGTFVELNLAPVRVQLVGRTEWGEDESMTTQPTFHSMRSPASMAVRFGGCELFGTFTPPDPRGKRLLGFVSPTNLAAAEKEFADPLAIEPPEAAGRPRQVSLITEYIEVDAQLASNFARELNTISDATAIRLRLDGIIAEGEAELLASRMIISTPRQRAVSQSIREFIHPVEYDPPGQLGGPLVGKPIPRLPQTMRGPITGKVNLSAPTRRLHLTLTIRASV